MAPTVFQARSQKAVAARRGDASAMIEASRNLAAAKLEQYIERVVADAPPLTPEQRDRLASILRDAPTGGGAL